MFSSPITELAWPRVFQEVKVNVKQCHYRNGVAQNVPGIERKGLAFPIHTWHGPEGSRKLR